MRKLHGIPGWRPAMGYELEAGLRLGLVLAGTIFASQVPVRTFGRDVAGRRRHSPYRPDRISPSDELTITDRNVSMPEELAELHERLATASDRERVETHNDLSRRLLRSDPAQALHHAKQGLAIAATLKDRALQAECYLCCAMASSGLSQFDATRRWVERARRLFAQSGNELGVAEADAVIVDMHRHLGEFGEALQMATEVLEVFRRHEDHERAASMLRTLGIIHDEIGDYPTALQHHFDSLRLLEDHDASVAKTLLSIMVIYHRIRDQQKSLEYGERALELYRREGDRHGEARALGNIGVLYRQLGDRERYRDHTLQALAIYRDIGNRVGEALTLRALGSYHYFGKEYDEALRFYREALEIARQINDRPQVMALLIDLAEISMALERPDEAIPLYEQALQLAQETSSREGEMTVHEAFFHMYEAAGDAVRALQHYKQYVSLKDQMNGVSQQKALSAVQTRFELERAEREREIHRLKAERLELEMQLKMKELTSLAMQLVQKNEMLDELKKQISDMASSGNGDGATSRQLKPLLQQIETSRNSEQEWDIFESQFRALHPEFMDRMAQQHPDLSPAELKVCALLKINLATKEVANILCCSTRTIEDHRYRIRTKLGLEKGVNLISYLMGVG